MSNARYWALLWLIMFVTCWGLILTRPVCSQDGMIQCSTVTYVTPSGRMVTCQQCYYPGSGQVVVSNCI